MVTKIKNTKLGTQARIVLTWIMGEVGSFSHATPSVLKHHCRGRKVVTPKELEEVILPALVDAGFITVEEGV